MHVVTKNLDYFVAINRTKKRLHTTPRLEEGLLLWAIRTTAIPSRLIHDNFFCWLVPKLFTRLQMRLSQLTDMAALFRLATDVYSVILTLLLFVAYMFAYTALCLKPADPDRLFLWIILAIVSFACLAVALIRLYEVMSFTTGYFAGEDYQAANPTRAVFNTIWHACEVIVAFSILYLWAAYVTSDPFSADSSRCIQSGWVNAAYYSFVTITTVGYGDFSPQRSLGKILVCWEIVSGFFLLVVVMQRALSVGQQKDVTHVITKSSQVFVGLRQDQPKGQEPKSYSINEGASVKVVAGDGDYWLIWWKDEDADVLIDKSCCTQITTHHRVA